MPSTAAERTRASTSDGRATGRYDGRKNCAGGGEVLRDRTSPPGPRTSPPGPLSTSWRGGTKGKSVRGSAPVGVDLIPSRENRGLWLGDETAPSTDPAAEAPASARTAAGPDAGRTASVGAGPKSTHTRPQVPPSTRGRRIYRRF